MRIVFLFFANPHTICHRRLFFNFFSSLTGRAIRFNFSAVIITFPGGFSVERDELGDEGWENRSRKMGGVMVLWKRWKLFFCRAF
jgi:hypothetical protein